MSHRDLLLTAGLLGMTGVRAGASGAHALHESLTTRQMDGVWQTAVSYHLVHRGALLALAGWKVEAGNRLPKLVAAAALCWIGGVLLFSGPLYALAMGAPPAI
jgi:uncharacterized membrane protein YgdD (TMEM256/DUF423 family)